ncbi:MAG: NAD(P)-binding domain-containing protein [Flavobacteriales bacterium]|nr:NAD(P)-binding domain-containing protein [Flavobacteriales bacterium]
MNSPIDEYYDIVVVGAGPAGLGVSILLERLGLNYLILERDSIGASFKKWPKETRFISPSFTGNFFKMPDLNAVSPDSSPAFELLTEHPTGEDYVQYLNGVADYFKLSIETEIAVEKIEDQGGFFIINTTKKTFGSQYIIWAAGEYQYPKKDSFDGAELCTHYSEVSSFSEIKGRDSVVIGAYESGFDATVNLTKLGKEVTLVDNENYLELINSDSSYSLSPFTRDRSKNIIDKIDYLPETRVKKVDFLNGKYLVFTNDDQVISCDDKPIDCTGFDTSLKCVNDLFNFEEDYPLINEFDESRKTENLFLVGPQVKHGTALFCFIYKYRQRFAIVAEEIARRLEVSTLEIAEALHDYKNNNFYLQDLSCCDDECIC